MKRFCKLFLLVCGVTLILSLGVAASDDWVQIRSKNFLVVGNTSEKAILRVTKKLERFRLAFSKVDDRFDFDSEIPITVIVFRDQSLFKRFKPTRNGKTKEWVAGFFRGGEDVNYIALSLNGERAETYQTIFHEYVHFLIKNTVKRSKTPTWLNEGLAEYYENLEIEGDKKVMLGASKSSHLRILRNNPLIPADKFFDDDFVLLDSSSEDSVNQFYAQAWAFIHYLNHGNSGKRKDQLHNYLLRLKRGEEFEKAFRLAFEAGYDELATELKDYLLQNTLTSSAINLPAKLETDDQFNLNKISTARAKSIQGDLLYRLDRLDDAEVLLNEAIALDPNDELGNISLGLVKMKKGEFGLAKRHLDRATANGSQNYLAFYYHAFVMSRSTVTDSGIINEYDPKIAEEMRRSLSKAIELNPKFAESYNLTALISIVQNQNLDDGLENINRAIELAPSEEMFHLRKSQLLMRKKRFDEARMIVSEIIGRTQDNAVREFAENLILRIGNFETQTEISNRINKGNIYVVKENESLTPQELADLHQRIEIDSINKNLRKPDAEESRILGRVVKIDCAKNGVVFLVNANESELRFVSKTFKELIFYTYQIQLKGGAIGCESDLSKFNSIITYRPSVESGESNGELVSIEFVPEYFEFRK